MEEKLFTRKEAWDIYLTTILGCSMIAAGLCMKSYDSGRRRAVKDVARRVNDYMEGYRAGENKENE